MSDSGTLWHFVVEDRISDFLHVLPDAQAVFHDCGIALSDGSLTLNDACDDPQAVLQQLAQRCEVPTAHDEPDRCGELAVDELIDHIITTHHIYTRWAIGRLIVLCEMNPDVPPAFLKRLKSFGTVNCEHLNEEEQRIFPACHDGAFCLMNRDIAGVASEENLFALNHDHSDLGRRMSALVDESHAFEDSPSMRRIQSAIRLLSTNLRIHSYKEDEYLLPALAYANELKKSSKRIKVVEE